MFNNIKELFSLRSQINNATKKLADVTKKLDEKDRIFNDIVYQGQRKANEEAEKIKQAAQTEYNNIKQNANIAESNLTRLNGLIAESQKNYTTAQDELNKLLTQSGSMSKKLKRANEIYKSIIYTNKNFLDETGPTQFYIKQEDIYELEPTINLRTHSSNIKDLRKQFNNNNKLINDTLKQYSERYTTKTNQMIYQLMVIALRAELQNILTSLKYEKLDKALGSLKNMTDKYLALVVEGNQSIAPTIKKFIGQIEYLFTEAIKIEYEYFIRQEQIKEEQRAIREQMRQEAEERKILEQQKRQIEQEEGKYQSEIQNTEAMLATTEDPEKKKVFENRIQQLQDMLTDVQNKKDEIIKRQNGQAGYVYVISNLGSFGDKVFKIGMTRRLDPQERIDELGDASVPFSFDVHGMIFSENAVNLEKSIHEKLDSQRVNKINARKEFFNASIDDLEVLINDLEPSAEFNKTMLAVQYRQTLAINEGLELGIDIGDESDNDDEVDESDE